MRSIITGLVSLSLSAAAVGQPASIQDEFIAALERSDYETASKSYSRLMDERLPRDGVPRRDALLNALAGIAFLHTDGVEEAALYLSNAPVAELPENLKFRTTMALGKARELSGLRTDARDAYRAALTLAGDGASRDAATIALARQVLVEDHAAARQLLAPLNRGSGELDWEVPALLAVIEGIASDKSRQAAYVERAWSLASRARAKTQAIQKVAVIRAGMAAVAGDRVQLLSMLSAANGQNALLSVGLTMHLPVCGENGIVESDYLIVGAVDGPSGQSLWPLAASRPEIVANFYDHVAPAKLLSGRLGGGVAGSVATVRCAPFVTTGHGHSWGSLPAITGWMIEKGFALDLEGRFGDGGILRYSQRIDQLTARFGNETPLLIEPQISLAGRLQTASLTGQTVMPGRITDLIEAAITGLRRYGAPEEQTKDLEQGLRFFRLTRRPFDEATISASFDIANERSTLTEPGRAKRGLALAYGSADERTRSAVARTIVANRDRIAKALTGIERISWLRLVAAAQDELGDEAASLKTLAGAGFPADLCVTMNEQPKLLDQNFSPDDFPGDAKDEMIVGQTALYMDVLPSGKIARPRVVLAVPSLIFDQEVDKGVGTIVYSPPKKGGRAASCRGVFQTVRWILPTEEDFVDPWTNTPPFDGKDADPIE